MKKKLLWIATLALAFATTNVIAYESNEKGNGEPVVLTESNIIPAGEYKVTANVKIGDDVSEASIPAEFKKYLGEYSTIATLSGDNNSLVITENNEDGLFNGFEIKDNAVAFSPEKTIVLNGKTFTVRALGDPEEIGTLGISSMSAMNNDEFTMSAAAIYYNGKWVATVTDIIIRKAVNTIPADMYAIKADVAIAEGTSEASVPAEFKKYLGIYNTIATLKGDESALVIEENKEEGLFAGFEIKGDAVKFSPEKTIVLKGKTFTVRAAGYNAETGGLAINASDNGYKMDNADIYYNGRKVATVSNIVITKATEEIVWKVTYVDYDKADEAMGDLTNSTSQSGYNVIKNGEVALGRADWGANYLTYILVDTYTMPGVVKKATLKAKVSGSIDSKRTTTWGVGYNDSDWSANMTWNTADKSITTIGTGFSSKSKSATTFENAEFDITETFYDGKKVKNILLYETAAAGGYVKDITVEIEMAASMLDAMKAWNLEAAEKLPAGDGLFCYSADALEAYKAAVNAAETIEEIKAIELPAQNLPEAEAYYNIENKTATGLYLNGTKISAAKGEAKLETTENGFYIKFDEGYLSLKGSDSWTVELSEAPKTVWQINYVNGFYTLQNPNGLLGSDSTDDGSTVYANKTADKNGYWIITKSDVTATDAIKAVEVAAPSTKKYIGKDGIVIEKNGVKYNAAGQLK